MLHRIAAVLLCAVALPACGGSDAGPSSSAREALDAEAGHIHGVGVDPADGSLFVATHSGLFRSTAGSSTAEPVGESRQDTMGFTVVGPSKFLGSGHPDPREADLPSLLGLIRSDDAGRTWENVSLLGEADFHVLRASGRRVYGVDATSGQFLVSADGGRTWDRRKPPAPVYDLALAPGDPDRIMASTERGLASSEDGGRTWRPEPGRLAGLLAWTRDGVVLVDGSGAVHRRAGRRWTAVGDIGGQPAALASHGRELYVGLHPSEVKRSTDGGRTWELRVGAVR